MNTTEVRHLLRELIDENPFAIRAVLKIVAVEFTDTVPTLAVTMDERPRLLINLGFVQRHCLTAEHVKAALCHEFLHVLLRHTALPGRLTPAKHLALDAVINAIIHRQLGETYSDLMTRYYADATETLQLLRPMTDQERNRYHSTRRAQAGSRLPIWWNAWSGLYAGKLVADDIEQLAAELLAVSPGSDLQAKGDASSVPREGQGNTDLDDGTLLGNHEDAGELPEALQEALSRATREMNGHGIWRKPLRGLGRESGALVMPVGQAALTTWKSQTLAVLRRHLRPAVGAARTPLAVQARLPVLSPSDRRAYLRASWSPFLPEAEWPATALRPDGRAQVYLDVSGSMYAEMPLVINLLAQLSGWIRRPFWAFSTLVAPAVIERGTLRSATSGGTSLECVLEHVERTRPSAAVIVTDGYIEEIAKVRVAALRGTRLHAIVTRDGDTRLLRRAGIPFSQLAKVPA